CAGRQRPPVHVFVRTGDDQRPLGELIRGLAGSAYPAHRLFLAVQAPAGAGAVACLRDLLRDVPFHWHMVRGGYREALAGVADGYWLVVAPGVRVQPATIDRLVQTLEQEPDAAA